jgi:hypothetical protein
MARRTKKPAASGSTDNLKGGTQGGPTAPYIQPGGPPGGTNALTPSGTSHVGREPEPPTGDKEAAERQDPQRIAQDERNRPSPDAAAQRAREDAEVQGSQSGVDEGNPRQIPPDAPTPDGRTGTD